MPSALTLRIPTQHRLQVIDVTAQVRDVVRRSGVTDGLCVVYVPHTTAGVTVNENYDPDVKHDVLGKLRRLFPRDEPFFQHAEGNSDSHLMTILTGTSTTIIVEGGAPKLGQWQGVWFCEYDGPRERELWVRVTAG